MKKRMLLFFISSLIIIQLFGQSRTVISGKVTNPSGDSLKIIVLLDAFTNQSKTYYVRLDSGKFEQEITVDKPSYLYISDGKNYFNGLIEPGEQTAVYYDAKDPLVSLQFAGAAAEKFRFLTGFNQFQLYKKIKVRIPFAKSGKYPFDNVLQFIDSCSSIFFDQLNNIRSLLSRQSFDLMKADIIASSLSNKYRSIGMVYHESMDKTLSERKGELTPYSTKTIRSLLTFDSSLYYSPAYINSVYSILYMHYDNMRLTGKADNNLIEKYNLLKKLLPASLRTVVLTFFLESDIEKLNQSEDIETIISKTYTSTKDDTYRDYILQRYADATAFKKGMTAPDFTLENEKGEKINLASFHGKVIYLDFWYASCGPCHALFGTIKPVKQFYSGNPDVVFLCVSIDRKNIWLDALQKFNIHGYHAFTEGKEINHSIIRDYKVANYPTTCLIDAGGKIFMANPSNEPEKLKEQIEDALKTRSEIK